MDSRRTASRSSRVGRGEAGDPRRTPLPPGQAEEAVFAQSLDPRRGTGAPRPRTTASDGRGPPADPPAQWRRLVEDRRELQARNIFFSLALPGSRLTLSPPGRPGLAGGPPPRPGDPRRTPRGPPLLPRAEERLSGSLSGLWGPGRRTEAWLVPRGPGPLPRTAGDPRRTPRCGGAAWWTRAGNCSSTSSRRSLLCSAGAQAHSKPARPPWLGRGTPGGPPGAVAPPGGRAPGTAAHQHSVHLCTSAALQLCSSAPASQLWLFSWAARGTPGGPPTLPALPAARGTPGGPPALPAARRTTPPGRRTPGLRL